MPLVLLWSSIEVVPARDSSALVQLQLEGQLLQGGPCAGTPNAGGALAGLSSTCPKYCEKPGAKPRFASTIAGGAAIADGACVSSIASGASATMGSTLAGEAAIASCGGTGFVTYAIAVVCF